MQLPTDFNASPVQVLRPTSTEALAVSTAAASAAALSTSTRVLRLICNQAVYISLDGTATTSSMYLPADTVEFIKVNAYDVLSAILASGSGTLYVTEMV
jgi:glutamate mutase epsilon subunit